MSMNFVWGSWRSFLASLLRVIRDLVIKAIEWNIWLVRNNCSFHAIVVPVHILILKINHMLVFWFSAASEGLKQKVKESMSIVRCSLEF